jgi:uncharacterized zinc-type alcohol dehydrogenase-like protein
MIPVRGMGVLNAGGAFEPFAFQRRDPGPRDVVIEIMYCGICHSDIHQARDEWGETHLPLLPGHEIIGRVQRMGSEARRFAVGQTVGVGCYVDSCRRCANCAAGEEPYCLGGVSYTYNSKEQDGVTWTLGGYSSHIVVDENYVLAIPPSLAPAQAAPLLCAGITTYSPLKRWGAGPGRRVGVMGLGGLGHMAVKLAAALGAEVTVLSSSPAKEADARRMGARDFWLARDGKSGNASGEGFDLMINTLSAPHAVESYINLLATGGVMVLLGVPPEPLKMDTFSLIGRRRILAGSLIGGVQQTQEMLDFCAARGIAADVEIIPADGINAAYDRVVKGDVRYRCVIDMKTLPLP